MNGIIFISKFSFKKIGLRKVDHNIIEIRLVIRNVSKRLRSKK